MTSVYDRVIEKITTEIASDTKNLHKANNLVRYYKEKIRDIEKELNFNNDNNSSIKIAFKRDQEVRETIALELEKIKNYEKKLAENLHKSQELVKNVQPFLDKITKSEHLLEYLKILRDIQEINNALAVAINGRDEAKIIGLYLSLSGEQSSTNSVIGRLQNVVAPFLVSYANKSAFYWYDVIKDRFSQDFENILKNIKWAQQGQVIEYFNPSKENMSKISSLAEYLFLIKPPIEEAETLILITPSIACPRFSIPVQLLLKQFRQRFQYHFIGQRQTNRLDKPEWYFTQILNWAKEYHLFVGKNFQPAAVRTGHENLNVRLEFIRGLVQLIIEKLAHDIEDICKDENLFAHLIDETLAFETELRESLGYPNIFQSAISVITQAQYLLKWISIEKKFCTNKMDCVLQGESPWMLVDPENVEELKIPRCADHFIRLLDAIKDRYSALAQPGHKMQFLNLQLELIDNFRRRLVQLYSSGAISITKILNAINYVNSVLREWGENVHYLHLHAVVVGQHATEIDSVFDKPMQELEHWQERLVRDLAMRIVDEIKARSMTYRHDNWSSLPEQNTKEPFILSSSAGEMFQIMLTSLHNLERDLSANLFNITIRIVASQLDVFFIDSLVMNTKFSMGGAAQFKFDMQRNLFALFGQYVRRPDLLFKKISDACLLLTAPRGNALLLHQTLNENSPIENQFRALKEMGILCFNPQTSVEVLERRTDIRVH